MEIKSALRFAGMILSPACVCLMVTAGCTTESELPLPPGAYVAPPAKQVPPENSAVSSDPALGLTPDQTATFPKDSEIQELTPEELTAKDATPQPASAKTTDPKTGPAPAKDDTIYTIRKNDTLSGIARRHGMTAAALADYNGISVKSKIYAGKTLRIPAVVKTASASQTDAVPDGATIYTVRSGDTLGGIAQKHSVRTADLAAANSLDVRKPIRVGQKLIIPKKATTASAATTPKTTAPAKTTASSTPKTKTPAKTTASSSPKTKTPAASAGKQGPAAGQRSADELLRDIGPDSAGQAGAAPASVKPASAPTADPISATSPAKEEPFDMDNAIEINIEREMTLEETAKAFDRPYSIVKKLNPTIAPDTRLKAGTAVKIPILF